MARFEHYIEVGQDRLRCGYTTGTCAAAAAHGAASLLLSGQAPAAVRIETPAGIPVEAELVEYAQGAGWAQCAVRKDGGDDADVTDGTLVFVRVERQAAPGVEIDGGVGVGRVTKAGLDQPVGAAAINSVPRKMIAHEVERVRAGSGYTGGLRVIVSVPEGERLAKETFNPRLGIVGGISILGTGGIVRPMSEAALIASLRLELDMLRAAGAEDVLITPGNYGEHFCTQTLGLSTARMASCSNYLGEVIDHAVRLGFRSLLLVGHLGKLAKVAGGCMNTHSKVADGRRETLTAHTALSGGDTALCRAVYDSVTTDEAVERLDAAGLRGAVMASLMQALQDNLRHRAGDALDIGAVCFSNRFGILGKTPDADRLLGLHKKEEAK